MTTRSRSAPIAAVLGLALVLTACGGTGVIEAEPATSPDPAVETESEPAPNPEPSGNPAAESPATESPAPEDPTSEEPTSGDPSTETSLPSAGADCSAQGATVQPRPAEGLPAEVAALRDLLLDAALRCDEQLLYTAIEESDRFSFSFGNDADAIGYWWSLEASGEAPYLRLAQVLSTTPALSAGGDVWVWPQVTTGQPEHTTEAAWAELTWLENPAAMRASGDGYLGWRAGISTDGQWRFFVAGGD